MGYFSPFDLFGQFWKFSEVTKSNLIITLQILQDTKSLIKHSYQETLSDANSEECKLFLKYLGDDKILDTLETNWLPDVVITWFYYYYYC